MPFGHHCGSCPVVIEIPTS